MCIRDRSKVDSSKWDYITVNVTNGNICVDSVCLNYGYLSLEKGDRRDLSATVCPANATNKSISWSSSNPAVATVSGGTVRAVGVACLLYTYLTMAIFLKITLNHLELTMELNEMFMDI